MFGLLSSQARAAVGLGEIAATAVDGPVTLHCSLDAVGRDGRFAPLLNSAGRVLNDPPGFDRGVLPEVDRKITAFFSRHLLR